VAGRRNSRIGKVVKIKSEEDIIKAHLTLFYMYRPEKGKSQNYHDKMQMQHPLFLFQFFH
jgi:hypothetical protein